MRRSSKRVTVMLPVRAASSIGCIRFDTPVQTTLYYGDAITSCENRAVRRRVVGSPGRTATFSLQYGTESLRPGGGKHEY